MMSSFEGVMMTIQTSSSLQSFSSDVMNNCHLSAKLLSSSLLGTAPDEMLAEEPVVLTSEGETFLVILSPILHLTFIVISVWIFYRDCLAKPLLLKEAIMAQSLNAVERFLLKATCRKPPEANWSKDRFDITDLSRREKFYLMDAIITAMDAYIIHGDTFHPGFVVSAIDSCMEACKKDRRDRVDEMFPLILAQQRRKALAGCFRFWCSGAAGKVSRGPSDLQPDEGTSQERLNMKLLRIAHGKVSHSRASTEEVLNIMNKTRHDIARDARLPETERTHPQLFVAKETTSEVNGVLQAKQQSRSKEASKDTRMASLFEGHSSEVEETPRTMLAIQETVPETQESLSIDRVEARLPELRLE
ncbi:unnamed protein product, partial [Polarella glacialis]